MIEKMEGYPLENWDVIVKINEIIDQVNRLSEFKGTTWNSEFYTFPCIDRPYWFVNTMLEEIKAIWNNWEVDKKRLEIGNCFESEKEAQEARKKIKEVLKH